MAKTDQLRMIIGIWHADERLNRDGFLLVHPHIGTSDNLLKPWNDFFRIAQQNGVLLLTLDQVSDFSQIDAFLFIDCPDLNNPLVRRSFEVDKPRYLITYKSEVEKPENWQPATHTLFDRVFTWDDRLINHTTFIKIHHAQNINDRPVCVPKDGLCTLVASARSSSHPSELYSERIQAIRWFETNQPEMFDLYGIGWDAASFPSYRGRVDRKLNTLQRYKFAICYEDANHSPGYITEKIFDCFKARCLPIYLGAPNIDEYIPPTCFIDRRKFESYEALYAFIVDMSEAEYQIHLKNIERFLETVYPYQYSSDGHQYYYRFTSEHFSWTLLGQLLRDKGERLKTNPLVSVVVPTYNYGRFIDKAITSIIAQNIQDLEVIVLDNASTDDTENRVASYLSDKRFRYVRHPSNIGGFNNCQRGFQMALGKYVVLLSSDDFLLSGHLQTLVSALETNPKCVLAYAPCVWVDDDDKVIRVLNHPGHCSDSYCGGRDELSALLVHDCYITPSAAVIRRSALDEVGPTDPYLWSCGDWDLWIRLAMKHGDFAFSRKPSVCYRVHSDQQSHSLYRTIHPLTDCMRILEKVLASDQAWRLAPHIPAVKKLLGCRFDAYPREMTHDLVARIESIEKRLAMIQQGEIRAEYHPDTYVREPSQSTRKTQDGSEAIETTPNRLEDKQGTGGLAMIPMVSVIVPTYNRPETLLIALHSILDQTYKDFEIIVVNDAGSDVENIIRFLDKDRKITYIRHGGNRDRAAARNTGIRIARGKYIAYLDDDDIYYPDHLGTLLTSLQRSGQKVAYTDAHRAHQEKIDGRYVVTKRDLPYSFDFDHDRILVQNFIPVLCLMHEKSCLDVVGQFDESLTTHEDWDLLIRLSRRFPIAHIKKVTCEFVSRTDGSTTTSSKRPDFRRTMAIILERYLASAAEKPHVRAAQDRVLQQLRGATAGSNVGTQPACPQEASVHNNRGSQVPVKFIQHNIRLDNGVFTKPGGPSMETYGWFVSARRILNAVFPENRNHVRIADLGCLEGGYAVEFARMGFQVVGIDVRATNIAACNYVKANTNLPNLRFIKDDVWNVAKYGPFDAVFCCGLLYHLDKPKQFLKTLSTVTTKLLILNTHFSTATEPPAKYHLSQLSENEELPGRWYTEFSNEEAFYNRASLREASWDNRRSFWIQREYLLQAIKDVGFDLVMEQFDSLGPDIADGILRGFRKTESRGMFIGIKTGVTWEKINEANAAAQPAESQQIGALLQQADEYCKMGDLQSAKALLGQALEILPDDPQLILTFGNIVLRFGDVEGARREFVKATVLRPDYAPAHADLAAVLLHLGRSAEAEASARRALELDSTNVSALKILAKVCLDTERYQEAVHAYATILQHAPNDIETLILVGNCYAETGRLEDAKSFYRRVLQLEPGNTIALENLSVVSDQELRSDQADLMGREASERNPVQISIIIPVFNRLELTRQCLEAVRRHTPPGQYEIIVIDNGSSDGTTEFLRQEQDAGRLRAIVNAENGGFARACNQGSRAAGGTYLLFLNNDTEVQPGWFEPLVAVLNADPAVGAVGSKLLFPNGAIQHAGVIVIDQQKGQEGLIATHIYYRKMVDPSKVNQSMTYQVLTAACLLIRRGAFEQVQGFDEQYWNGYEDVDLCFKLQEGGWLLVYEPKSVVIHYESQSGTERFRQERDNVERLKRKWTGRITADLVVRPDGSCADTGAHRIRSYQSPSHSAEDAAVGVRAPLPRDRESADPLLIRGEKASPQPLVLDKVTETLRRTETYLKNEDPDAASRVLTEALTQTPDNPDLIVALGHVAWKQGDLEKARLQFVRAATLEPNYVQAHTALAILLLQLSRFAEAEEAARKALAIDAAEMTALKVLAKVCLDTERYQEAVQAYATILEHAPDDIETLILVGNCYAESGRLEQARGFYGKALGLDPGNQIVRENLAEVDRLVATSDGTAPEPMAPAVSEGRPSVSIVIVTYNSASSIRACLDSVLGESRPATEVIVVDNVSTDATRTILDTYRDRATVILNTDNIGFSAACNQGIRASSGDYVVLLNPDTVVTPRWLERLLFHFGPDVGAVGPVSDHVAGNQNIDRNLPDSAPRRMGLAEVADLLGRANKGKAKETKLLTGFCLMVPRKVLDEVGLLDEDLFLGNDDLDLSWRLRLKGYKLLVATDAFVHHDGQVSFKSEGKAKTSRLVQESTDKLYAKLEAHYGKGNAPDPMELWGIDWFRPSHAHFRPQASSPVQGLTSIIILVFNGLEHTIDCLKSLNAYTPEPHEIIVVDNGSTDGTVDYLRRYSVKHENIRVIANSSNKGFAAGNNQGLSIARGEYLLLLNNDTMVTSGWLKGMLKLFKQHQDVGIAGPMSNHALEPQLVPDAKYQSIPQMEAFAAKWSADHAGQSLSIKRVIGFCLMTTRRVIDLIGGLDERFGSGNFEDDDLCCRANLAGFQARIAQDVYIHHTGGQTFKIAGIDYSQSLHRNWELFKAKWGIPTDAPYGKGYCFPSQIPQGSDLSIPLPNVGADHRCDDQGRWWQEISERPDRSQPAVTEEMPLSVVIVPNGHGLAPLWPSLVQYTKHPLAITILPSHGNGNGDDPAHEATCPDGWRISTSDLSAVRLLNQLMQSADDDPVILLSSDLILTPGWLKRLLAAFNRDRHIAVVGPTLNQGPATQRIKAEYKGTGKALRQFGLRRAHRYGGELAEVDSLAPFCIVFKGSACRPIGPLREDLDLAASLHDYFARLRQAGRKVAVILDTYAHYEPHADLLSVGARRADVGL